MFILVDTNWGSACVTLFLIRTTFYRKARRKGFEINLKVSEVLVGRQRGKTRRERDTNIFQVGKQWSWMSDKSTSVTLSFPTHL